jgi:phenylacetate-CoA ligase
MTDGWRSQSLAAAIAELAYAYENVPFFEDYLNGLEIRPGQLRTAADFRRVPPTSKADYRRNFPTRILVRGRSLDDPLVHHSQSSGTGGERLQTVAHTYVLAGRMAGTTSVHPAVADGIARQRFHRPVRYAAPNCSDVECASPHTTMKDRILADGTLVLPVSHDLLATPTPLVEQAIAEIAEYRADWFYADATHLAFLLRQMRARHVPVPPVAALALTYTLSTGVARRQLDEYFPADIPRAEVVSMSELGWVAMECPNEVMHLNTDNFYQELLVDGRPAEPGEPAELITTGLGDDLEPHIRYRTGDIYTLLPDCGCGHRFPAVRHEGRATDLLIRGGLVVLTPKQLDELVGPAGWADVYKLHQLAEDRFSLRFVRSAEYGEQAEREVTDRLLAALGPGAQLAVEASDYLPCERSGKFISCTSAALRQSG